MCSRYTEMTNSFILQGCIAIGKRKWCRAVYVDQCGFKHCTLNPPHPWYLYQVSKSGWMSLPGRVSSNAVTHIWPTPKKTKYITEPQLTFYSHLNGARWPVHGRRIYRALFRLSRPPPASVFNQPEVVCSLPGPPAATAQKAPAMEIGSSSCLYLFSSLLIRPICISFVTWTKSRGAGSMA